MLPLPLPLFLFPSEPVEETGDTGGRAADLPRTSGVGRNSEYGVSQFGERNSSNGSSERGEVRKSSYGVEKTGDVCMSLNGESITSEKSLCLAMG